MTAMNVASLLVFLAIVAILVHARHRMKLMVKDAEGFMGVKDAGEPDDEVARLG